MKQRFRLSREIRERLESFMGFADERKTTEEPEEIVRTEEPEKTTQADDNTGAAPFVIVTRTDVGKVRQSNQDTVFSSGRLCGVADGMGGHRGGEVASSGLKDLLLSQLEGKEPAPALLLNAIRAANRRLYIRSQEDENLHGMGTTLDALWLGKEKVFIGHVGDSRVYLLRDGELRQVTEDHSMVMEMVRAGVITLEQAATHPMRNIITRAVGTESNVEIDLLTEDRKAGDVWLVCSDGLHGMVNDETIKDILSTYAPEPAADELMEAALRGGGHDNISVVILSDREGAQ